MALPIIDLSPYLLEPFSYPPTAKQQACSSAIHEACLEYGFFYVTGLGIPQDKFGEVLELAQSFFDLPADNKEPLSIASSTNGTDGARGYQKLKVATASFIQQGEMFQLMQASCRKTRRWVNWIFTKAWTVSRPAYIIHCGKGIK